MILPLLIAVTLAADAPAPVWREVAPGVTLILGDVPIERGPDGNTIVFTAPDGLVVVDTGRHVSHSDKILALAGARRRPIAAIINTHWHLDHSSGNRRLRAVFPDAPILTTNAIDRTLTPDGFLARNVAGARARLIDPETTPVEREERANFIATMEASDSLRPTAPISASGRMRIAGRRFDVHVTTGAVTDADVWLYDRRSRVVVLGDLVTFPSPFFETACPNQWRAALDAVWATPFRLAIPGHGEPMTRAQFDTYRTTFGAFLDCVNTDAEAGVCAAGWLEGAGALMIEAERAQAVEYATYYVGFLRENGAKSPTCLSN